MGNFIPKILLCGELSDFFSRIGNHPFKIVGQAYLFGEDNGQKFNFVLDNRIFFNDRLQDLPALVNFLQSGAVDYFVFVRQNEYAIFRNYAYKRGFLSSQVITLEQFKTSPLKFPYHVEADLSLLHHLKISNVKTLLDVDGYFSERRIFTKFDNDFTEIDAVIDKPLSPVAENIYTHTYKNLAEVGFKRYDAVLIIEREPADFENMLILLENFSDNIITFARRGSELEKYIFSTAGNFAEGNGLHAGAVNWYFLKRRRPPEDFKIYVVTYKNIKLNTPPEGYKIIQAGRTPNGDFGYDGDDTGDNISHLNVYLNELTALYWLWKNTTHEIIGLCHYRRFLTESNDDRFAYDKILTKEAALKILERYDIIVSQLYCGGLNQREFLVNDCGESLTALCETIFRKHISKTQPDYLDSFEYVFKSPNLYKCHLFITRKNVLDAYSKWLFSFLLDTTEEVLHTINLAELPFTPRRLVAFFAERMLTVWLIKNRLRIKELKIMQVPGL